MNFGARATDPETSHAAAASVNHKAIADSLYERLEQLGDIGATSEELADQLGLSRVTVSPQLRPMAREGLVVASDDRRKGKSGRMAIVWKRA